MDVVTFQRKWIASTAKERSAAQEHFLDLCALLDVPTPNEADPSGDFYAFERGATKATGGNGWADVWYKGHFAWEYKGKNANLTHAYQQLQNYRDALESPPLMIVSDLNIIRIHTNFTATPTEIHEFALANLAEPGVLPKLKRIWTAPRSFKPRITTDQLTADAAGRFVTITRGLEGRNYHPETTAHFLVQVMFCLFAEDVGILPNKLFTRLVKRSVNDHERFPERATELFRAMQTGGEVAYEPVPHVNGGLFAHIDVPHLIAGEIMAIDEAAGLDWSAIEPAIFGTLFERALDPEKRSQLGAHYTSRADIERVVEPVVIAPLRREWNELRATVLEEMENPPKRRKKGQPTSLERVDAFLADLRDVTVLDPACGSGNFLYVALNALLNLEKEVRLWRATTFVQPLTPSEIRPTQMKGIEINAHAQQLAQAAIWIGYLQWRRDNGFGWNEPILDALETIEHKDALLTFHDDGTVTETEWPPARFIIGNPPFLGGNRVRQELGPEYVNKLFAVFSGRVRQTADLVVYFFEKARVQIERRLARRAGLLATNSIRGGVNRDVLGRINETGGIYLAWSDEPWVLDGAAVRISIIGFDDGSEQRKNLNGSDVAHINPDLTATVDITMAKRLPENRDLAFEGDKKAGPFDIDAETATLMLRAPVNVNGRSNADVVRPWVNGRDLAGRSQNKWIIDFGTDMPEAEAALYELPFEHVVRRVKPERDVNRDAWSRENWWLHQRPRPLFRAKSKDLRRYIVTIRHSKHRLFAWFDRIALADSALVTIAREDDYFFGVLHSRAHELWSLRMGTWLGKGNDPRYTPTTTFETYPFPWPPGQEPVDDPVVQRIAAAAKDLDDKRNAWLNPEGATEAELKKRTLTNLYNQNPTWLRNLHATLDRAVWDAYGWPADEIPAEVDEDVILGRLLALNLERANIS